MSTETNTPKKTSTRTRKAAPKPPVVETAAVEISLDELNGPGLVAAITAAAPSASEDTTIDAAPSEILEGEIIEAKAPQVTSTRVVTLGGGDESSTMFSNRTVPWMKLGKLSDSVFTAREAAIEAGLDFEVTEAPVAFLWDGEWVQMSNRKTIVRKDTGMPMSITSSDYPILQYSEAFDFIEQINPEFVAAGALKGGKQGFMVVRVPDSFELNLLDGDKHEMYMILRTSHDLTRAVEVAMMPLRMRCMNQLTLRSLTKGVDHRWTIRHTSTMHQKLAEAKSSLENYKHYVESFKSLAERLAGIQVSQDKARMVLKGILPELPKTEEKINSIIALWQTGDTVGYTDNGWGFVNSVSDYYDWGRSGGSAESRFVASLQGQTHNAVNKVMTRVLAMA